LRCFGLIGFPLNHSFSPAYFTQKFQDAGIDALYKAFPIKNIEQLNTLLNQHKELEGLNVTIPYKSAVIPFLHKLSLEAQEIGAVNCIKIEQKNNQTYLIGYNTDAIGFEKSLIPLLQAQHTKALILGNGGAAKAISYVLKKLNITFNYVVRNATTANEINFNDVNRQIIKEHCLIINTTPLGTFPDITTCPDIPYESLDETHLLYDLVYNPEESLFLKKGKAQKAHIKNGYEMLLLQADASWDIWNNK
jgi:shikimate dehydrogenase